jgi:hypothetical protein
MRILVLFAIFSDCLSFAPTLRVEPAGLLCRNGILSICPIGSRAYHTFRSPRNGRLTDHAFTFEARRRRRYPTINRLSAVAGQVDSEPAGKVDYEVDLPGRFAHVVYTPPKDFFEEGSTLMYMGGCNGWNGETDPAMFPLIPAGGGEFKAKVYIPPGASVSHQSHCLNNLSES